MNPLITILARGGSKRLPDKNIKPIHGKPLVRWTIDQALEWGKAPIIVSSDSARIRSLCPPGIYSVLRPKELAEDSTPKLDAIRHAHRHMEMLHGVQYDPIIDLDVTNPIRTVQDIDNCVKLLDDSGCVVSMVSARRIPGTSRPNSPSVGHNKEARVRNAVVLPWLSQARHLRERDRHRYARGSPWELHCRRPCRPAPRWA